MSIGSVSGNPVTRRILDLRAQLDILNGQLSTGQKGNTYGALGAQRSASLNAHSRLAAIDGYRDTIDTVNLRINITSTSLSRFTDLANEQRANTLSSNYSPTDGTQTSDQQGARLRLEEVVGLLNQDINGRRIFSGRATDQNASLSADKIIDGDAPQIGLKGVITERTRADLGSDGRGRLALTAPNANEVQLADTAGVFGYKTAGISSTLSNATATDTAGPPRSLKFAFSGVPAEGQAVQINLTRPDGTVTTLNLRATTGTPGTGDFQIGADANATATNFQLALDSQLKQDAKTELRAASAAKAADDFFNVSDSRAPQRVNIVTTPEAATGLRDGTPTDTVKWYQGDGASDDPRSTATARVDTNLTVGYGLRATEPAFRSVVASLAVFAAAEFDPNDASSPDAYRSLGVKVRDNLGDENAQKLIRVQEQIAGVQKSASAADERHVGTIGLFDGIISDVETVTKEDVATQVLELQTRLQASYQVTANLSKLSLVNYI